MRPRRLDSRLLPALPFEFYRTQIAPFDVLPFVKPNHWVTMVEEMQANHDNYLGQIQTAPVRLLGMPQATVFGREARLLKDRPGRLPFQAMFPRKTKEVDLDLLRPGALRPDGGTQAPIRPMETHQMLLFLLAEKPSEYATWTRFQAVIPANAALDDQQMVDVARYYRIVSVQDPKQPNLSSHPLTWTTISHFVWDEVDPAVLNVGQRQAMVDWLHWGGQLIVSGGAGRTLALLGDDESFLAPYLPALPSGENGTIEPEELEELAERFQVPGWKSGAATLDEIALEDLELPIEASRVGPIPTQFARRYHGPGRLVAPPSRPVYLAGLRPRGEDTRPITTRPGGEGQVIGFERRVGRGRILALGFDLKEPAFMTWKGYDTFVRRVLMRRVEDNWNPRDAQDREMLSGPALSWVRYVARDLGAPAVSGDPEFAGGSPPVPGSLESGLPMEPVAAWLDDAAMPSAARGELARASGIEIPGSSFVLRVMVAYILALVPLNWLICRFVLKRQELAWVIVPILALGVAGAVERAAAIDMGYDIACDEIDLLELQPGYSRAHLSRFGALYSTGRERFTISYPGEPSALALPLNANTSLRGEDITESSWQSSPLPALSGFRVEPRSLAMFRAEQMMDLGGMIGLVAGDGASAGRRVANQTDLELREAVLIEDFPGKSGQRHYPLGNLGPGQVVELPEPGAMSGSPDAERPEWVDLAKFLGPLKEYHWGRPEDRGGQRLVAWARDPRGGQELEPKVDRHRGFTLIVAHLGYGPPPSPDGLEFDLSADGVFIPTNPSGTNATGQSAPAGADSLTLPQ
jgi:hypothetical protein